jgi:hypothetical protein
MMYRLTADMMLHLRCNDVARFARNDAMFAQKCGDATHHSRSEHHLSKANIMPKKKISSHA